MIKTIFMGTPQFAVPILNTLIKETEVVLVVTQPDRYVGRKRILTPSPVKEVALKHNIPIFQPYNIKEDYEEILKYKPDLIITCAYGQIIPKPLLTLPRLGCINIHASLLPKYRGGAPIHHALINGEEKTGVSIMYMDEAMDTGDIIETLSLDILPTDNVATLQNSLSQLGADLLKQVLPQIINKTNKRLKQDDNLATYAKTIKRADEHLDFQKTAQDVFNRVRGVYPSAYFLLNQKEVKVLEGYIGPQKKGQVGVISDITKNAIGINCLDNIYYITKLKPFGKNAMSASEYLRGTTFEKLKNSIIE